MDPIGGKDGVSNTNPIDRSVSNGEENLHESVPAADPSHTPPSLEGRGVASDRLENTREMETLLIDSFLYLMNNLSESGESTIPRLRGKLLNPQNKIFYADIYALLAWNQLHSGLLDAAESNLCLANSQSPQSPFVHYIYAIFKIKSGNFNGAKESLTIANDANQVRKTQIISFPRLFGCELNLSDLLGWKYMDLVINYKLRELGEVGLSSSTGTRGRNRSRRRGAGKAAVLLQDSQPQLSSRELACMIRIEQLRRSNNRPWKEVAGELGEIIGDSRNGMEVLHTAMEAKAALLILHDTASNPDSVIEVLKIYQVVLRSDPSNVRCLLSKARFLMDAQFSAHNQFPEKYPKDYLKNEITKICEKILELYPSCIKALRYLSVQKRRCAEKADESGNVQLREQNYEESKDLLKKAFTAQVEAINEYIHPNSKDFKLTESFLKDLFTKGEFNEYGRQTFAQLGLKQQKSTSRLLGTIISDLAFIQFSEEKCLMKQEDPVYDIDRLNNVMKIFDIGLKIYLDNIEAYYGMALVYELRGELNKCKEALLKSFSIRPSYCAGEMLERLGFEVPKREEGPKKEE